MGFLKFFEAAVKTVTIPVTVALDVIDAEVMFDEKKSLTRETLESIAEDIDEIAE